MRFLDSSVIVRAYLRDEPGHDQARELVFGGQPSLASELARVEVTRGLVAAHRAGRITERTRDRLLAETDRDLNVSGIVRPLPLHASPTLDHARQLVLEHGLRTLDAIHLAVADLDARRLTEPGEDLLFATRDADQAAAARALGLLTDP